VNSPSNNAPVVAPVRGHTCRELYKAIFESDAPEQMVRQLPAQTLFMVVKEVGLSASCDILSLASLEQIRLLSDLDLWHGDVINEEQMWEWLSLADEGDSLEILQKVLKCLDLKLISILISKYVEVQVFEESTDNPPAPGFYTPDKGFTWIGIKLENEDHHFLLARLLALIFETSTELFYQLLSVPSVATVSMLEEEGFQERTKRLAAEGVPEPDVAATIHAPYSLQEALEEVRRNEQHTIVEDVRAVEPMLYEARSTRLFSELMQGSHAHDVLAMEFTYLVNAAIVRFGIDFGDQEAVLFLCQKIKGAINIGLEKILRESNQVLQAVYAALGLEKLYQVGLAELMTLRSTARKITLEQVEGFKDSDPSLFSTVACAREPFPSMPIFLQDDGSVIEDGGALQSGERAIETMAAVNVVGSRLAGLLDRLVQDAAS
jgi:hypothetical protein